MSSPFTFTDARRIVREHLLDQWTAADGRLAIAESGYESPTHWQVIVHSSDPGADGDPEYVGRPDSSYLVSKESGAVEHLGDTTERAEGMSPYGPS